MCVCVCVAEAIRSLEASTRVGLLIRRCCVYVCQEKGGVETGRGMGETVLAPDLPVCWPLQSFASLGCVRIRRSTGRHIFFSVSLSPFPPTTFCFTLLHFASQHLDITGENKSNLNFFFFSILFRVLDDLVSMMNRLWTNVQLMGRQHVPRPLVGFTLKLSSTMFSRFHYQFLKANHLFSP